MRVCLVVLQYTYLQNTSTEQFSYTIRLNANIIFTKFLNSLNFSSDIHNFLFKCAIKVEDNKLNVPKA